MVCLVANLNVNELEDEFRGRIRVKSYSFALLLRGSFFFVLGVH